jgi:hypothetical protein
MNITIPSQVVSALTAEASRRNSTLVEGQDLHTAESIAQGLLSSASAAYEATAQDNYVRSLYERIKTADPATQSSIFSFAESKLLTP